MHSDERGPDAIPQAIERAKLGAWGDDAQGDRIADLRALLVATHWTIANLAGAVEIIDESGRLLIDGNARPTERDKALAARALERSLEVLSDGNRADGTWETASGHRALEVGASAFPVLGVAIVAGAVSAVGLCAWLAKEAVVATHKLSVDANMALAMVKHAELVETTNAHIAEERAAGRRLPLSEATKAKVDALLKSQEIAAKGNPPPIGNVAASGGGFGSGLIVVALLVGAALLTQE